MVGVLRAQLIALRAQIEGVVAGCDRCGPHMTAVRAQLDAMMAAIELQQLADMQETSGCTHPEVEMVPGSTFTAPRQRCTVCRAEV